MTANAPFDAAHPVDDRYAPPDCGELAAITEVLADGRLSGGARVVPVYEQALATWFGVRRAVAVNSGTSALHATLISLGVRPGDEVLVPATAPVATAMPMRFSRRRECRSWRTPARPTAPRCLASMPGRSTGRAASVPTTASCCLPARAASSSPTMGN